MMYRYLNWLMGFLGFLLFSTPALAQNCAPATAFEVFENDFLRTGLLNGGDSFWDLSTGQFKVKGDTETPSLIQTNSIWMGGIAPDGQLLLAAQRYRFQGNDFWPGPLDDDGSTTATTCGQWDSIWQVSESEIYLHIQDFNDNGSIDGPIPYAVLTWPARGNVNFEQLTGISLPDQELAPFYDINDDGIYDPTIGEYPVFLADNPAAIPRTMAWLVINDNGGVHTASGGNPLGVEVQQLYWTLTSQFNPTINYTVFRKDKVTNKSGVPIDSFHFSAWLDVNIGCFNDDRTGSIPELNSFYFYNGTPSDGACGLLDNFGDNPPVFSHTFLNATLSSYRPYLLNGSFFGEPQSVEQFYHLQTGRFYDGNPVEYGGDGYLEDSFEFPFFYPSSPTDQSPDAWSELSENTIAFDRRGVGTVGPYFLDAGASIEFDQAFSFHQDTDLDNIETVDLLYSAIPEIQAAYDEDFQFNFPIFICLNDCVWPGDTNADGIVDALDIVRLANLENVSNSARALTSSLWYPYNNPQWPSDLSFEDGLPYAFADANGDGTINGLSDLSVIQTNYGQTNRAFSGDSGSDVDGTNLLLKKATFSPPFDGINPNGLNTLDVRVALDPDDIGQLTGIAFEIEFDESADFEILEFNGNGVANFDLVGLFKEGERLLAYGGASSIGTPAPGQLEVLVARFRLQLANIPDDCELTMNLKNVQAIRADGSFIELGNQDRVWPISSCVVTSTEAPTIAERSIILQPNPARDQVQLLTESLTIKQIEVFDLTGRQVLVPVTQSINPVLQVNALPEGLYLVRLQTDQGIVTKRMVVQ